MNVYERDTTNAQIMETGSNSVTQTSPESLNGLKFGQKIYFEDMGIGAASKSGGGSSSTGEPAAAGKKVKGTAGGFVQVQPPRCQVEGCKVDLTDAKAYYSRHKVCGTHSKSPKVIVGGIEQRFCQQCSRFHQLPEFDQGKRSCRRRLAGHNERRRKPPPGAILPSRFGRLSSSIFENSSRSGGFLMDFSAHARLPGRGSWPTTRPADRVPGNHQSAVAGRWAGLSEYPPDLFLHNSAAGPGFPSPGIPPGGESFSSDASCALSLLSNQPWSSSTRNRATASSPGVSNNFTSPEGVTIAQVPGPHDSCMDQFSNSLWGFKGHEATTSSHSTTGHFSNELEMPQHAGRQYLELDDSSPYGSSSTQHMHWSL